MDRLEVSPQDGDSGSDDGDSGSDDGSVDYYDALEKLEAETRHLDINHQKPLDNLDKTADECDNTRTVSSSTSQGDDIVQDNISEHFTGNFELSQVSCNSQFSINKSGNDIQRTLGSCDDNVSCEAEDNASIRLKSCDDESSCDNDKERMFDENEADQNDISPGGQDVPEGFDKSDSDAEDERDKEIVIDEEALKEREAQMTEEERQQARDEGQGHKERGNALFHEADYEGAREAYTDGLMICPLSFVKERSIMYSNRAACKLRMEKDESAIEDCTKAVELHPTYLKAYLRRAELYEKTDKLEDALVDYQKILELDPSHHPARQACMRLPDQIKERNEKMKEEMMGKLKELGNMVLKPFGLSTNNFQLQQDPNTGSYSVNFQQTPKDAG